MSRQSPNLTSFNGGEISPRLAGRVDQAIYHISTAEMLNFVPTVEGPAMKRSGFRFIRAAAGTWLTPFIFSDTQAYVLEWASTALRFYTNGGRIESDPVTPYQVTVPYSSAEAPAISTQQSYDRLYIAHGSHPPASLLRTSATTFTYAALSLKTGPFQTRNSDETITVTVNATTGSAVVTSTADIFLAGHVGGPFMVEAMGFSAIKAWEPQARCDGSPAQLNVGDLRRSDGKVYQCVAIAGVRTGTIQPTHIRGAEWDGSGQSILGYDTQTAGAQWLYLYDSFGVGTITGVAGPRAATISITRRFADSLTGAAPSYRWSLPALYPESGWPKHVLLAFGRLIFLTDFWLYASVVGDYGGGTVDMAPFSDGGLIAPDQAFSLRLDLSNPILWARKDRDAILIGTADGVYAIRKINSAQIFASDNVEVIKQSHFGVSSVLPVQTGNSTIFVQAGGRKLREAGYSLDSDRYIAPNLNVWQRQILKSGATQLAFQGEPDEVLLAVRADGQIALHPHVPEQEIKGFSRISHGRGAIQSACVIPGGDGTDQLWIIAAGGVELQDPPWEEGETALADGFFVDSGATYSGTPTAVVTGLDHLEGLTVAVLADGAVVSGKTIAGGTLTLDKAASKITVGATMTARLTTLRPEGGDAAGNVVQGLRRRLVTLFLRVLESAGVKIDAGGGHIDFVLDRSRDTDVSAPPPVFTGLTDKPVSPGSWSREEGQFTIISDDPLPCMVVAALPRYEFNQ